MLGIRDAMDCSLIALRLAAVGGSHHGADLTSHAFATTMPRRNKPNPRLAVLVALHGRVPAPCTPLVKSSRAVDQVRCLHLLWPSSEVERGAHV